MRVKGESPNVPIILVGNKADLDHARQVYNLNALLNTICIIVSLLQRRTPLYFFFHFRFRKRKFRHWRQNGIWNISKQVPRQEWMLIKSFMIWWKRFTSKRKRLSRNRFQQNRSRIVVWKNLFRLFGNICKEIAENELLMIYDSKIMTHDLWVMLCDSFNVKNALLYLP